MCVFPWFVLCLCSIAFGYNPDKDLQGVYSQKDYNRFLNVYVFVFSIHPPRAKLY